MRIKDVYNRIEYLGYYQIIGGSIGILSDFLSIYNKLNSNGFYLFSVFIFYALCGISIYSGILLIQKKYLRGLYFSTFTQATQLISFILFGFIFEFAIGFFLRFSIELTNDTLLGFEFWFVNFGLSRSANPEIIELNINIIAIFLLLFIAKSIDRVKAELKKENT